VGNCLHPGATALWTFWVTPYPAVKLRLAVITEIQVTAVSTGNLADVIRERSVNAEL